MKIKISGTPFYTISQKQDFSKNDFPHHISSSLFFFSKQNSLRFHVLQQTVYNPEQLYRVIVFGFSLDELPSSNIWPFLLDFCVVEGCFNAFISMKNNTCFNPFAHKFSEHICIAGDPKPSLLPWDIGPDFHSFCK